MVARVDPQNPLRRTNGDYHWPNILDYAVDLINGLPNPETVTLRQLLYRLAQHKVIENTPGRYRKLSNRTAKARRDETFPRLAEGGREISRPLSFDDVAHALRWTAAAFRFDRTIGQAYQVWVVLEKDTLFAAASLRTQPLGVPVVALRGFGSQTIVDDMTDAIVEDGRPARIIYIGDFDPTGIVIEADLLNRLRATPDSTLRRIAIDYDQIAEHDLTVLPAKPNDKNRKRMIADYGRAFQVEAEALDPAVLDQLLVDALDEYVDKSAVDRIIEAETEAREQLGQIAEDSA